MSARTPASLRRRVTLACAALGLVMTLLFAAAVIAITEDYEHVIASEVLRGQAEDYSLRIANRLPVELPRTQRLSGWLAKPPDDLGRFGLGVHEDERHEGIHVGVFDTAAGRMWFTIDLGDIEQLEVHLRLLLAAMVVLGVALAGWLGWLFAGRALAPVRALSQAVDRLPVAPQPTRLRDGLADDELGHLARAIDDYQARLVDADDRQLAFFADASHALRTPIAVVQGVTEVMLDMPAQDDADAARLQRLDRGAQELGELVELLFGAARRAPVKRETMDTATLLSEALAPWPERTTIDATGAFDVAHRETVLLLRALVRKYLRDAHRIVASRSNGQLMLVDADAVHDDAPRRSDAGALSPLLARAAERAGWMLEAVAGRVVLTHAG
ncbi:Two-component sensor histidine kinase [Lysobacter dokdonensis DS-58]|uniref:histidine kinase n=1 Tax=Lysobacter dokdonensis DS-58 TaxID=1300345 RepID=A0A0A2WM13_9GAMM|nr:histidine kinase dimerization/phospho-acceptor domain-containing protein [Lysobacter dokdonensis]KGQ19320.1 Two-component sensor histidine kinase [Lysobacter dokdonensis DS-58]